jgi:hypothetical protein
VFGIGLFTTDGVNVYGTNTHLRSSRPRPSRQRRGPSRACRTSVSVEGTYLLDVAAHRRDGTPYDYHRGLYSFRSRAASRTSASTARAPLDLRRRRAPRGVAVRPEIDLHDED